MESRLKDGTRPEAGKLEQSGGWGWKEWSELSGWSTVGVQGKEEVRMKPGHGLNGQSPDGGFASQGKGGVMRAGWVSVSSMCPAPLPILSGSQAQADFSHLGLPWQPQGEAVEHLGIQVWWEGGC